MVFQLIGISVLVFGGVYGFYKLWNSITFKPMAERYQYKKTVDAEGNEIIQVIDLQDVNNKTKESE